MSLDAADRGRLRDILDWGTEARVLAEGMSVESFVADRRTYLAVLHCIQIVGEAGWRLSAGVKESMTGIPWPLIASMRHRLVHDYGRIDAHRIYSILHNGLPELLVAVQTLLSVDKSGPEPFGS